MKFKFNTHTLRQEFEKSNKLYNNSIFNINSFHGEDIFKTEYK